MKVSCFKLSLAMGLLLSYLPISAITFPEQAKQCNHMVDSVNQTVTLIFPIDTAHYAIPMDSIAAVYAWGSPSEYHDQWESCRMTDFSEDSCFYKTFTYDEINRPGNSGQPEFEFFMLRTDGTHEYMTPDMMVHGLQDIRWMFINGYTPVLIVLPGGPEYMTTDWDELYARNLDAITIRPLSDFDLTDPVDQHRISNFRRVPATTNLYRSYHPFYPSNPRYDTEVERLHWVAELATQAGIQSLISLTGNYEGRIGQQYVCGGQTYTVTMPDYYRTIRSRGNICYISSSISQCYYHAVEDSKLADDMKTVVEFINDTCHPMPVQVHCAVGADRTGIICAVIAALCGADWQAIKADYMETVNMRIRTYRHPNRLRYAFEQLVGRNPELCTANEIAAAIRTHLVDRMHVLTNEQIDNMVTRLRGNIPASFDTNTDRPQGAYDLLGRPVSEDYRGVVIQDGCTKLVVGK